MRRVDALFGFRQQTQEAPATKLCPGLRGRSPVAAVRRGLGLGEPCSQPGVVASTNGLLGWMGRCVPVEPRSEERLTAFDERDDNAGAAPANEP